MKSITFILLLLLSCFGVENIACAQTSRTKLTQPCKDSVVIDPEENYKVAKCHLKDILKDCPEFNKIGLSPDESYLLQSENNNHFDCEACRDDYYRLYAYFLKIRNGRDKYKMERRKLVKIFRDINFIYGRMLDEGGVGHRYLRVLGYAEYSVYVGKTDSDYYFKNYDITKQKAIYIAGLKQLITDEFTDADNEFIGKEKIKAKKELFETVNEINGLITNSFYLKMAQWYQYSNY
jgi:hypothetical protein